MKAKSYYSHRLNLILEILEDSATLDGVLSLKAIPVQKGVVNEETRILSFVEKEHPITPKNLRDFGPRLLAELPEYAGTRTAVVTQKIGPTAGVTNLSKEVAHDQRIGVFFTVQNALNFLGLSSAEVLEEIPEAREIVLRYQF